MSLPEITLAQAVGRQYRVTMRTLGVSFYRNLIFLEICFCLLSFFTFPTYGTFINQIFRLQVLRFNDALPLWIGLLYVTAMAWLLADNRQRSCAFTFVSNRLSHNLANIATLATMSAIASLLGTLSMVFVRVSAALWSRQTVVFWNGFRYTPHDLLTCVLAIFGYTFLCAALCYLFVIGLRRCPNLLALIVPLTMFLGLRVNLVGEALATVLVFFITEGNIIIFTMKTLITAALLFGAACWGSQRLEVRR